MSLIDEAIANGQSGASVPINQIPVPDAEPSSPENVFKLDLSVIWEFIKKPVGPGELEEYRNSPLCFDKTEGLGRIIWGLSGLIGYALTDIARSAVVQLVIGIYQWPRERVKNE